MKVLTNYELNSINGGAVSGAIISSIIRGANIIFEIGRSFGSSIRRFMTKNLC